VIYILLPIHNRREITLRFVACLLEQTDTSYQLVLIDDGSTDGSAEAVQRRVPDAIVISGDGRWWWAGSLQEGYDWLSARSISPDDLVLIANDDTRFERSFLARGRAAMHGSRRRLLLAQLFASDYELLVEVGVRVNWSDLSFEGVTEVRHVNCLSTRGLFMSATDFLELGGFHRHLLPHYGSDYEFTLRAIRRGFEPMSVADVRLSYDPSTTGIRDVDTSSFRGYVRTTLSRRSVAIPVYWTSFVVLACQVH
jgi:GT2 family glycosyltransferase